MNSLILASLYDVPHVLYIIISIGLTILVLYLANKYLHKQKHKDRFLKVFALLTVFLHISPIWVKFLRGEPAIANDNMLFPIYFCNLSMYLLLIVAFTSDKNTKTFKSLATMMAYSGIIGAVITLFYPEFYLYGDSIFEWGMFKSFLSHSTMLVGAFYLFSGGYVKIEKQNTLIFSVGLLVFGALGLIVNITFRIAGLNKPNAMYLQSPPIAELPFLNAYVIAILLIGVVHLTYLINESLKKKRTVRSSLEMVNN